MSTYTQAPPLAPFQALGLSLLNSGTGLLCPAGRERGLQRLRSGSKSVLATQPLSQVATVLGVL